eukprot:scaffold130426_cov53-Attheya_sp.AAC.1
MSFEFCPSSDDEEDDQHHDPPPVTTAHEDPTTHIPRPVSFSNTKDSEEDGEEEEFVDWQDGVSEEEEECDDWQEGDDNKGTLLENADQPTEKGASLKFPTEAVTIQINGDDDVVPKNKKYDKKKKKRRTQTTLRQLPEHVEDLLQQLHRTHLLTLVSRSIQISKACHSPEVLHASHSLLPPSILCFEQDENTDTDTNNGIIRIMPTMPQVQSLFHDWFLPLVHHVESRRQRAQQAAQAAGAPLYSRRSRRSRRSTTPMMQTTGNSRMPRQSPKNSHADSVWNNEGVGTVDPHRLLHWFHYVSPTHDADALLAMPQSDPGHGEMTHHEKVQLLVAAARSLTWRVRYVTALQPMDTKLTVDHALFSSNPSTMNNNDENVPNVLRQLMQMRQHPDHKKEDDDEKASPSSNLKKTRRRQRTNKQSPKKFKKEPDTKDHGGGNELKESFATIHPDDSTAAVLGWVEILCQTGHPSNPLGTTTTASASRTQHEKGGSNHVGMAQKNKWVHLDVAREVMDDPACVEQWLCQQKGQQPQQRHVSYVLAVEHHGGGDNHENQPHENHGAVLRLTDVTPRYATTSWAQTLRLRGATASQVNRGKCVNRWWADTLGTLNRSFRTNAEQGNNDHHTIRRTKKRKRLGHSPKTIWSTVTDQSSSTTPTNNDPNKCSISSSSSPKKKTKQVEVLVVDSSSSEEESETKKRRHGSLLLSEEEEESFVDFDQEQEKRLSAERISEPLPTNKEAFKNNPFYVLEVTLKLQEVLAPDAKKRICGMFKGQLVYRRSDVSTAMVAKKWLYHGRRVLPNSPPIKLVKARKTPIPKTFKALTSYGVGEGNDGSQEAQQRELNKSNISLQEVDMNRLFAKWQTDPWSPPPVGPNEVIPTNEFRNMELKLLNPGLVHLEEPRMSIVAKKLGLPYAPCLLGFEGHGGNRTPTIRGIVVHEHNVSLLREAHTEYQSHALEQEFQAQQNRVYGRWKRLIVGMLTKDRIEREYKHD